MIKLWRNRPVSGAAASRDALEQSRHVFPSARQALTAVIDHAGLRRSDRVALPEWSSHCVIDAVGRVATPLPLEEVLKYNIQISAVLIYEQWGWPFSESVHNQIGSRFKDKVIVLDCVDSADIEQHDRLGYYKNGSDKIFSIYSLSKLLGLKGGGIARGVSGYCEFESAVSAGAFSDLFWQSAWKIDHSREALHIHKSEIGHLHKDVQEWISQFQISHSLASESRRRKDNLKIIAESAIADSWPRWMHDAVAQGAAPGIVPFKIETDLTEFQKLVSGMYGIETAVYNFNWSGNPLQANYSECVAFPIHGEVSDTLLRRFVKNEL